MEFNEIQYFRKMLYISSVKISRERIESISWKSLQSTSHYDLSSCCLQFVLESIPVSTHPNSETFLFLPLSSSHFHYPLPYFEASLNSAKVEMAKLLFRNFHQQRTKWAEFPMDIRNIRLPIST